MLRRRHVVSGTCAGADGVCKGARIFAAFQQLTAGALLRRVASGLKIARVLSKLGVVGGLQGVQPGNLCVQCATLLRDVFVLLRVIHRHRGQLGSVIVDFAPQLRNTVLHFGHVHGVLPPLCFE